MIVVFKTGRSPLDIGAGDRLRAARTVVTAVENGLPIFDIVYNNYQI